MIEIREDDLSGEATRALLAYHLAEARANSPPGSVYSLDLSGLLMPEVTVWTGWRGDTLLGVGALREWYDGTGKRMGELKSMRTHPERLRQGVAAALLEHIIGVARARSYRRLSLETGSGPAFEPALAMYRKRGFVDGAAFSYYQASSFNRFMHLDL